MGSKAEGSEPYPGMVVSPHSASRQGVPPFLPSPFHLNEPRLWDKLEHDSGK